MKKKFKSQNYLNFFRIQNHYNYAIKQRFKTFLRLFNDHSFFNDQLFSAVIFVLPR